MKEKITIGIILVIVLMLILIISGSFEKLIYKISPQLYGSFYRGGLVWNPEFKGEFKTYTSNKFGLQISYPDSWLVEDNYESNGGVTRVVTLGETVYSKTPDNHYANNMVIAYEELTPNEQVMSIEKIRDEYSKAYENHPSLKVTMLDKGDYQTGEYRGFYLKYLVNRPDGNTITKEVIVRRGTRLFHLTSVDAENEFPQSSAAIDRMLTSFKFI